MEDKIRDFFEKHVLPLHNSVTAQPRAYLDLDFDRSVETYFTDPVNPEYVYLNNIQFEDEQQLEAYLAEFWKDEPALLSCVSDLSRLAFTLKKSSKEQSSELSPFIYAMF